VFIELVTEVLANHGVIAIGCRQGLHRAPCMGALLEDAAESNSSKSRSSSMTSSSSSRKQNQQIDSRAVLRNTLTLFAPMASRRIGAAG